ncbi:hypothetical protein EK72_004544 [Salmonella enterica subsp. enterica]|nr:hypothetical protein [Salmonella enterica subsp. enterica]
MSNVSIDVCHVSGSLTPVIDIGTPCKDIIEYFIGDDHGVPPLLLTMQVKTKSGRQVTITIPYDTNGVALVNIDGDFI